jgi:processive 1,2-diacylglycerol beta-glucosyltransferase
MPRSFPPFRRTVRFQLMSNSSLAREPVDACTERAGRGHYGRMDANRPTRQPRVLIASATVGAGHNSVARAIVAGLRHAAPHIDAEFFDALSVTSRLFRAYYAGSFELGMTRLPELYGKVYHMTDKPHRPGRGAGEYARLWMEAFCTRRLRDHVRKGHYDLVVSTHFLAPPHIAHMNRLGEIDLPQFVVVTDYRVHRFWYCEGIERWFVPAAASAEVFDTWGIPPEQVTVSGIPLHPKWTDELDREEILNEWSLPADRDIVLLSGGTEYTCGPIVEVARDIVARCESAIVIVLAGRNKNLLASLSKLPEAGDTIRPMGFTDRIHELTEVGALFVTKPGGVTVTECCSRGAPMVLMDPVPGQEGENADHLESVGAAVIAHGQGEIVRTTVELLNQPDRRARMAAAASGQFLGGLATVVDAIVSRVPAE